MLIPTCTIQTKHPLNTPSTHTHERCLTRAFSTWLIATSVGVVACRRDERGEDLHIWIECCFGILTISSQLCTLERSHHWMPGNFLFFFIFYKALSGDVVVSDTSRMSSPEKTCHLGSPIPVVRRAIQIKTTDRGSEGSDGSVMELVPILTATLTRPYPGDDEAFAFLLHGQRRGVWPLMRHKARIRTKPLGRRKKKQ